MTFTVNLRIIGTDGTTERIDLNDTASGYHIRSLTMPDHSPNRTRYTSPRSKGDFASGPPLDAAGTLAATVRVMGSTWAQVETRFEAMRTAANAETDWFYVELVREGVTRRWRTDPPRITEAGQSFVLNEMYVDIQFHVQPNPSVTIA